MGAEHEVGGAMEWGQAHIRFLTRAPSLTISFGVRLFAGQVMRSENMRLQHEKSTVSLSRWHFIVCVWRRDLTLHPPFPLFDPIDCPWRLPSTRLAPLLSPTSDLHPVLAYCWGFGCQQMLEKITDNKQKIKQNKVLPYLVGNVVEVSLAQAFSLPMLSVLLG